MEENRRQYLLRKIKGTCSDRPARLALWVNDDLFASKVSILLNEGFSLSNDLVLRVMREVYSQREDMWLKSGVKSPVPAEDMKRSIRYLELTSLKREQDYDPEYNSSSAV